MVQTGYREGQECLRLVTNILPNDTGKHEERHEPSRTPHRDSVVITRPRRPQKRHSAIVFSVLFRNHGTCIIRPSCSGQACSVVHRFLRVLARTESCLRDEPEHLVEEYVYPKLDGCVSFPPAVCFRETLTSLPFRKIRSVRNER